MGGKTCFLGVGETLNCVVVDTPEGAVPTRYDERETIFLETFMGCFGEELRDIQANCTIAHMEQK